MSATRGFHFVQAEFDRVRQSLSEDAPEVALRYVPSLLEELSDKRANFLRPELGTHLQHAIGVFLDRVRKEYEGDMRTFAQCNVRLSSDAPKALDDLQLLEHSLEEIRLRN